MSNANPIAWFLAIAFLITITLVGAAWLIFATKVIKYAWGGC